MTTSLHAWALASAEFENPGGEHLVTSIEIDGDPTEPGVAWIQVSTRVVPSAERVDIRVVPLQ